jgi:hypothetical protein
MSCLLSNPKTTDCEAKAQIGGLRGTVWALNLYARGTVWALNLYASDGTKLLYTESGNTISAITVQSGLQAFRIDAEKFAHDLPTAGVKNEGGNVYFEPTLNLRTITDSDADITWESQMVKSTSLVFVVMKPNGKFLVVGQYNGMDYVAAAIDEGGQTADSSVLSTLGFIGRETDAKYKILDVGTGEQDTYDYMVSLETPAA